MSDAREAFETWLDEQHPAKEYRTVRVKRRDVLSDNEQLIAEAAFQAGRASSPSPQWMILYRAVNEMMAYLGAYGSIEARGDRANAVMDALATIDGGTPLPAPSDVMRQEAPDDTQRLDYLERHFHIDATGDENVYATFVQMESLAANTLREAIDAAIAQQGEP